MLEEEHKYGLEHPSLTNPEHRTPMTVRQELQAMMTIQEHQLPETRHRAFQTIWKRNGKVLKLSPPCLDTGHPTAGVGLQAPSTVVQQSPKTLTQAFEAAESRGR